MNVIAINGDQRISVKIVISNVICFMNFVIAIYALRYLNKWRSLDYCEKQQNYCLKKVIIVFKGKCC